MLSHFLKNKVGAGIGIGLLVTVVSAIGLFGGLFSSVNSNITDTLYTRNEPSNNIVIIAVDDKSTQANALGRFNQWKRSNFTDLLKVLEKENAKVVTIDFVFHTFSDGVGREQLLQLQSQVKKADDSEKLNDYQSFLKNYSSNLNHPIDNEFADELAKFPNLVLDATLNPDGVSLIKPLTKFMTTTTLGFATAYLDERGIMKATSPIIHVADENKDYDDIALATAKKYLGKEEIKLPLQNGKMQINFFGEPYSFEMISFVDVLNRKFTKYFFKDKIILVGGTSSKELHDEYLTPRSNVTPMPGIEIIANEIQTIIDGKFLSNQSVGASIFTVAVISIGLAIALNYLSIWISVLVAFASILLYILTSHAFYKNGTIVNMFYPLAAILLTYLASWIYKFFISDKKKRELKSAFGHYVSGELVEQISQNPDLVKLGGEKKVITVFFSDIKDSTAISEKTPIEMWVSQVNEYFTEMENVVKKSGGTLDKYEGDAVMGFWNAPVSQTDHIFRAYACAIGMRKALVNLHTKWATEGKPLIEFRIGINTGEALVGNFGSKDRFDFTVMGDTVNTASRLESSANKTYGTSTIVAGFEAINSTSPQLQNFTIREVDTVYLPGKKEPVKLYELLGLASEATPEIQNTIKTYTQGLAAYRCKDFATAIENFQLISSDKPAQILLARCQKLQAGEKIAELDEQMIFRIQNK
ncbi:MAG: CHASE2 domain-containing protein [Candidatus Peregrinibacteria bacterium]|nr:CHASE2 domain-containing protein [Candidatus Peregrinibacteria bacterium]